MDPLRPLLARLAPWLTHRRWPAVRAVLILFHVVAIVSVACPAPVKGGNEKQWNKPSVRAEVASWTRRLRSMGLDVTEQDVSRFGMRAAQTWGDARNALVSPFQSYLSIVGATQGWYMFTAPDRAPQRFALSIETAAESVDVFELGRPPFRPDLVDPDFLDHHRVRRAFFQAAWSERPVFREVCGWLAREIAAKQKDMKKATCRLIQRSVLTPAEARAPQPVRHPDKVTRTLRVGSDGKVLR